MRKHRTFYCLTINLRDSFFYWSSSLLVRVHPWKYNINKLDKEDMCTMCNKPITCTVCFFLLLKKENCVVQIDSVLFLSYNDIGANVQSKILNVNAGLCSLIAVLPVFVMYVYCPTLLIRGPAYISAVGGCLVRLQYTNVV